MNKPWAQVMLRYIDSGDDIGVALSPQLMYNVVPDCDIFNHQNVHFWEMMQPGMDALNFISLTGAFLLFCFGAFVLGDDAAWHGRPSLHLAHPWVFFCFVLLFRVFWRLRCGGFVALGSDDAPGRL